MNNQELQERKTDATARGVGVMCSKTMRQPTQKYHGRCGCGSVQFEIEIDLFELTACHCAICQDKKVVMAEVNEAGFRLLRGIQALSFTQLAPRSSKHYFCKGCDVYPFQRSRETPDIISVNIACFDKVDAARIADSRVADVKAV